MTKLVNKINECLSTKEDSESIEKSGIQLNNILDEFDQAHNTFHQLTKIEELKESEIYLQSVHELVSEVQENSSISGHTYWTTHIAYRQCQTGRQSLRKKVQSGVWD